MRGAPRVSRFLVVTLLFAPYGCTGVSPSVEPLAKLPGWRDGLSQAPGSTEPVLEIAYEEVRTDGLQLDLDEGPPDPEAGCTTDWIPYRMVLAVDRDALPPAEDIQRARTDVGVVSSYPATSP